MKTFNDLEFKPHKSIKRGFIARLNFPNKYGISVIFGNPLFRCSKNTYEVAILKNGHLCYSTPITDDVLGYQSIDNINAIMKEIQEYNEEEY